MSDSSRTADDARAAFQSCKSRDPKDQVQFYDSWAENYEEVSPKKLVLFRFCFNIFIHLCSSVRLFWVLVLVLNRFSISSQDHTLMSYRAPDLAVNFLSDHFSGNPEDALVLDVACGSGWVARVVRPFESPV